MAPVADFPVQFDYAQLLWTNVVNGVGVTLTANGGTGLAPFNVVPYKRVGLLIAVVGAVTGTTPSMTMNIVGLDNQGNSFNLVSSTAITSTSNSIIVAGPGIGAANMLVPQLANVTWTITGTTPNFANVQLSLYGR